MNNQQCIMSQFDALIRKNKSIEQSEYLMSKRYNDCLVDIDNSMDAVDTLNEKSNEIKLKYSSTSKSIEKLKGDIAQIETDIKQVKKGIQRFVVKDNSVTHEMMYHICTPTPTDQQTISEKMWSMDLWNMFKHSNEVSLHQGIDNSDNLWKQFRFESTRSDV